MKKNVIQNKRNNNYAPQLPEEQINKIVQELSDPKLSPIPYSHDRAKDLTNKVTGIVNDLITQYNHKIIKIIEKERKEAFMKGIKEGEKHAKK